MASIVIPYTPGRIKPDIRPDPRDRMVNRLNHTWKFETISYSHGLMDSEKPPLRGAVSVLSKFSADRLTSLLKSLDVQVHFKWFITLTYRIGEDFNKKQLNSFLTLLRRSSPHGLSYIWVLEFTKNGIEHFHLLSNYCPRAARLKVIWPWGRSKKIRIHKAKKMGDYMGKEISKEAQKFAVEFRGRWWGNSRDLVNKESFIVGGNFVDCTKLWQSKFGHYAFGTVEKGCSLDDRDGKGLCFLRDSYLVSPDVKNNT